MKKKIPRGFAVYIHKNGLIEYFGGETPAEVAFNCANYLGYRGGIKPVNHDRKPHLTVTFTDGEHSFRMNK